VLAVWALLDASRLRVNEGRDERTPCVMNECVRFFGVQGRVNCSALCSGVRPRGVGMSEP
jgi:hypothetical protein